MDQVKQRPICSRIRDRRITMFGHVRRLQESVPAHEALRLAVNTHTGVRPDDRLDWKRPRGRPRHTWIRQLEIDVGLILQLPPGIWPVIVKSGGRNDPSPVKQSSE